jgi:hypothetical protein
MMRMHEENLLTIVDPSGGNRAQPPTAISDKPGEDTDDEWEYRDSAHWQRNQGRAGHDDDEPARRERG